MTGNRLVKVTSWEVFKEYRDAGRRVHIIQMDEGGRVPCAWWFETVSMMRKRQAPAKKLAKSLGQDLARINRKAVPSATPKPPARKAAAVKKATPTARRRTK